MGRINIHARIKRHSRILKDKILQKNTKENLNRNSKLQETNSGNGFSLVLFFVIFILPIYPSFSSYFHQYNEYEFDRGEIDEDTIIISYFGGEGGDSPILEAKDSFLSVNTLLDDERDLSGTNEIIEYEVQSGESFSSIAYKFKVSTNSIYWANEFTKSHVIHPGDIIKVPPVTGLIHQVKKGDTLSTIAEKYDVDDAKIIEQNLLLADESIKIGDVLVIPGAIKKAPPKPIYKPVPKKYITQSSSVPKTTSSGYGFSKVAQSEYTSSKGSYKLVWRKPQHTFYWGNCTWYVGQYKNVNWRGNAKDWYKNAQYKGHKVGKTPIIGAIIVFHGRGYNPRYGHVGIVMDLVGNDQLIVSDMNYRRLGEITYRKIPRNDRSITGYIYVD